MNGRKVNIIEAEVCPYHIHMLVEIPPKYYLGQQDGMAGVLVLRCAEYDFGFIFSAVGFVLGKMVDGAAFMKLGCVEINILPKRVLLSILLCPIHCCRN